MDTTLKYTTRWFFWSYSETVVLSASFIPCFKIQTITIMDSATLNLNPVHQDLITDFLKLSKFQKIQRLKSISYHFNHVLNFKIRENEAYTGDEIQSLLKELQNSIEAEVETEVTDCIHTNVLLLQQLLSQAEEWHMTLTANISELENREKLDAVKKYEEKELPKEKNERPHFKVTHGTAILEPEQKSVATSLKMEVVRLIAENDVLRATNSELQEHFSNDKASNDDLTKLKEDLSLAQEQVLTLQKELELARQSPNNVDSDEFSRIQTAVEEMKGEVEKTQLATAAETQKLKKELESREAKLRQVQSNLLLAEKELEKKFQSTGAYTNMKKILMQKNSIIKKLRAQLEASGIGEDNSSDSDVIED